MSRISIGSSFATCQPGGSAAASTVVERFCIAARSLRGEAQPAVPINAAKGAIHVSRGDKLKARISDELDAIAGQYEPGPAEVE